MNKIGLKFIKDTLTQKYSYRFKWMGIPVIQYPQDLIAMQEIIYEVKPDIIIETGVAHGGSLMFYATLMDTVTDGIVIGIDVDIRPQNRKAIRSHPLWYRIDLVEGSSVNIETLKKVVRIIKKNDVKEPVIMVVLDSLHTHKHVLRELEMYSPLVSVGSFLVVFDTIIEHLPEGSFPGKPWSVGNNPATAVKEFLTTHPEFEVDDKIEKRIMITTAPGGYIRRIK